MQDTIKVATSNNFEPANYSADSRRRTNQKILLKDFFFDDDDDDDDRASATSDDLNAPAAKADESDFSPEDDQVDSSHEDDDDLLDLAESSDKDASPTDDESFPELDTSKPRGRGRQPQPRKRSTVPAKATKAKKATTAVPGETTKDTKIRMVNLAKGLNEKNLDLSLPPIASVQKAFQDMVRVSLSQGFDKTVHGLEGRALRVATMCSGTESPLLAIQLIQEALGEQLGTTFNAVHLFSAEIVPYKQAYIERNFQVPLIFRDITELTGAKDQSATATTAYGAQASVPGDIDIIIAGTACVDYSMLNGKKKGIDENGESGDTFKAVLAYAKVWRPRALILENVFTAPWDDMLERYEAIGYAASGVLADTKNFYLPQTRQRGYMFCIDTATCKSNKQSSIIVKQWTENMLALRRQASSPAAAFLLPNDDPAVLRASALAARRSILDSYTREVDWLKCLLRHIQYRLEQKIGNARPYTSWQESGSFQLFDNADVTWFRSMPERVLDMIDCSFLRKALPDGGCIDINFKSRVINVSQNVDRNPDSTPTGIAPCITPSGIFYLTIRGGPLSAEETLTLQGLPLDKITFTTETNRQIQDMAGNAMSSTVVGAAILAALMATPTEILGTKQQSLDVEATRNEPTLEVVATPMHDSKTFDTEMIDVQALSRDAEASSQKCSCEGPFDLTRKAIQMCRDCGHTTCLACGGKPAHHYKSVQMQREDRLDPMEFHRRWKHKFPTHLRIEGSHQVQQHLLGQQADLDAAYLATISQCLDVIFQFEALKRGRAWSVIWSSDSARLQLRLDAKSVQWRLYAHVEDSLAANDKLRIFLQRPIATADVQSDSIFCVQWRWRFPTKFSTNLSIKAHGPQVSASWLARLQLPGYEDQTVPTELSVETRDQATTGLAGTYSYLPRCGTASESLYKRTGDTETPCYLMLDPDPIGDPKDDSMVFTSDITAKSYGEDRDIHARLQPSWRPWIKGSQFQTPSLHITDEWLDLPAGILQLAPSHSELTACFIDAAIVPTHAVPNCQHAVEIVNFDVAAELCGSDAPSFRDAAWMFSNAQNSFPTIQNQYFDLAGEVSACRTCLPPAAPLRWKWTRDMKALRPYEHPASATEYEAKLKNRPAVAQLQSATTDGILHLSVTLNLATLAHRALGKLDLLCSSIGKLETSLCWSVDPGYTETTDIELPTFSLLNNDGDITEIPPIKLNITLWPKQQRSLAWMIRQESSQGTEYTIEEVEEYLLPNVDWRVEVKAQRKHRVKGGIQASHPGFGKTICTLALIGADYHERTADDIIADIQAPAEGTCGPIHHAGTLVVAPKTLVEQWASEVNKVLGRSFAQTTIAVNTIKDLAKHSIDNFRRARIIIVNQDLLTSDSYVKRLAAFAGVPEPNSTRGRQYASWLSFVDEQIYQHARTMQEQGRKGLEKQIRAVYKQHKDDPDFAAFVPSKRLKGQAYAGRDTADPGSKSARIPDLDNKALAATGHALFEMFHFNRIVIDEFTYMTSKDYAAVENLKADKKWALSATAKLQDPYDIAKMADLIGVRLRVSENAPGALSAKNLKAILEEKTDFEQFQTFRTSASMAVTKRTFELAQYFLDTFVRQNILEFDDFPYQDHLVPVSLAHAHRLVYTEVSQHLNSADMRIKKTKKSEDRDREYQIADILEDVNSAEEALVRLAATFDSSKYDVFNGKITIAAVSAKRSKQATEARNRLEQAIMQLVPMTKTKTDPGYESWKSNVLKEGSLGDEDCRQVIAGFLEAAKKKPAVKVKPEKLKDLLKDQLSRTNELAKQYMLTIRSIRFVNNAQTLLRGSTSECCNSADCSKTSSSSMSVSSLCGHLICDNCWIELQASTGLCSAVGCNAPVYSYHLLQSEKLKQAQPDETAVGLPGTKAKAVIDLLARIKDADEQAILFVQYAEQIDDMEAACAASGIRSVCVRENSSASSQVTKFQTEKDARARATVIILNGSDSSAAGVNLTNANHVLFFSPLLTDSQYSYDAAMAQAIGRVRRPGQTKDIHVYRFVALDTIDVDILEHRERRADALSELGADAISVKSGTSQGSEEELTVRIQGKHFERTQLIKDTKGVCRLMPKSWLIGQNADLGMTGIEGRVRVSGYEDFSSLVKFSKAYSEDD
ncbi:hypothetical protein KVT40_008681 [Elsinoe batatas]|uniref:Helicase C-terminal domain-containing protein n=1 Tax=Elsinoe batatas TaxID=2601811 RepID=A0A8K0KUU8_9PEZI|nr:hypothetical protein KVT40_008681 [Elsinoe batatas]